MRHMMPKNETVVDIPVNIYKPEDLLTPEQALRTEGDDLWVISPPVNAGEGRLIMVQRHIVITLRNGNSQDIFFADTWLPIDLTITVSKEEALRSPEFNRFVKQGHIVILKPGLAKNILRRPEAIAETDRMAKKNKTLGKTSTDSYFSSLADIHSGKSDTAGVTAKDSKNPYETPVEPLKNDHIPLRAALLGLRDMSEPTQIKIVAELQNQLSQDECIYLIKNYAKIDSIAEIAYRRLRDVSP